MHSPPTDSSGGPNDLVVEIIETLETCGLEDDAYQLHRLRGCRCARTVGFLIRWGHHRPVYRRRNSLEVSLDGVDVIVEDESEASTNNDVRCGDRECSRKPRPLDVPRPRETAVRWPLVRFAHENAARLVPAVLAGIGDGRGGLPLLSPPGLSIPPSSDVVGWTGVRTGLPRLPLPPSASLAVTPFQYVV